jgi:hypothetical protein
MTCGTQFQAFLKLANDFGILLDFRVSAAIPEKRRLRHKSAKHGGLTAMRYPE